MNAATNEVLKTDATSEVSNNASGVAVTKKPTPGLSVEEATSAMQAMELTDEQRKVTDGFQLTENPEAKDSKMIKSADLDAAVKDFVSQIEPSLTPEQKALISDVEQNGLPEPVGTQKKTVAEEPTAE